MCVNIYHSYGVFGVCSSASLGWRDDLPARPEEDSTLLWNYLDTIIVLGGIALLSNVRSQGVR